ncbi:transferase family-domain-containing protein [Neohortaea acidophila]|uniref:Transferase family-domain-containing protein n=1 Tax=Neohortaea acidophila TaxID=245834 RepID=A0A6A6Q2P2_9PEZI|nr:transferase family-domain-containing protein [Neohortaea acidophila]KAF2486585.1 transferase family-domain-containing protein [Neohortaea acidophila]
MKEHIFQLSSLDHAAERVYLRCCFCFSTTNEESDFDKISAHLTATVKRTIAHMPILAGVVRPSQAQGQAGRTEVMVKREQVNGFKPMIKILSHGEFPHTYKDLEVAGMSPAILFNDKLTPLPNLSAAESSPAFGIQANFVSGGLLVALSLHQAVADIVGFQTIITHLSSNLPTYYITDDDIHDMAVDQSRLRDRLSGSRGAKVEASAVKNTSDEGLHAVESAICGRMFAFNTKLIDGVAALVNERLLIIRKDASTTVHSSNVLFAILWKGIVRARRRASQAPAPSLAAESAVLLPVNVRKAIDPALDEGYMGNATLEIAVNHSTVNLMMPFDVGTLGAAALAIHTGIQGVNEQHIRSVIAGINAGADLADLGKKNANDAAAMKIADWSGLNVAEKGHLGLGLGKPGWVRKIGREMTADGCTVHAVKEDEGLWEVMVEIEEDVMGVLLKDDGFMAFVAHVA